MELALTVGQQWDYIVDVFEAKTREQKERNDAILKRGERIDTFHRSRLTFLERGLAKAKKRRLACWLKLEFWKTPELSTTDALDRFIISWKQEIETEQDARMQAMMTESAEWMRANYDTEGNPIYPSVS